jgi:hypothetical protein
LEPHESLKRPFSYSLPQELRAFLRCGVLAHGFLIDFPSLFGAWWGCYFRIGETMRSLPAPKKLTVLALLLALLPVMPASAQPVVAPGETLVFSTADDGLAECRVADVQIEDEDTDFSCTNPRFRFGLFGETTRAEPANNFVEAIIEPKIPLGAGQTSYATVSVFNDFSVSESADGIVDAADGIVNAKVSATWDIFGFLGGGLAYNVDVNLFLIVQDITNGTPITLTSQTLNTFDRSSDQGIELSADIGGEQFGLRDEAASVPVALRRGRDYRIVFQVRSSVSILILGKPTAVAQAAWTDLRVTIDEDEFEQTSIHDGDIKAQLTEHDGDIKALLVEIKRRQEEIIRLLLTPQGQRESDLGDFPLKSEVTPPVTTGDDTDVCSSADCSQEQFCAAQRRPECNSADWRGDEGRKPRDCLWKKGSCRAR